MISFVNAKINIGLQVVRRRDDGYHDLQTVFYPVGIYAGLPANPETFCDILEIVASDNVECPVSGISDFSLIATGRKIDCGLEKNLVYKAASLYFENTGLSGLNFKIILDKHLPDGAGMGGGSADAAFTLRMLRDLHLRYAERNKTDVSDLPSDDELYAMALKLGADCPFFLLNKPAYATGVGEDLCPLNLNLSGKWLVVIKPDIYISTKEAFAGITPAEPMFDLRSTAELPIAEWRNFVYNDFECSIFPRYPFLAEIKTRLYDDGALYASMTGSGSCIYGIFDDVALATEAKDSFIDNSTIQATYLLKL